MATPSTFQPFCDCCGSGLSIEDGQILPRSKFCSHCGEELSPWIKKLIAHFGATPASSDSPATTPQIQLPLSGDENTPRGYRLMQSRGRQSKSRGRVRGRGRGRGSPNTREVESSERTLRTPGRAINYSVEKYYRDALSRPTERGEPDYNEVSLTVKFVYSSLRQSG